MPVPTQVSDLSTTIASNSPAGSDNVFPDLDNHIRALAGMLASVATNSATNGYSNPYLPNASAAVFNEAGADIDFRAEGDTDANLLFLDASTDRVGVGTSTPDAKLTVNGVGAFGDGAVGTPSISNTGDLNTGIWFPAADTVAVSTGGAEVARFDSSGNLGIGTSSPGSRLEVVGRIVGTNSQAFLFNGTAGTYGTFQHNGTSIGDIGSGNQVIFSGSTGDFALSSRSGNLVFGTNNGTECARITSGGDLLVGTTANDNTTTGIKLDISPIAGSPIVKSVGSSSSNAQDTFHVYSTGAGAYRFYVGYGGTISATSTTISAISDQRFKENIRDLDVGLNAIMALKPRKFDWKAGKGKDIKDDRGFIAQEFEQVFPDLIDEWKDPAPEGEEPYKSVRQDLIPVLVKAIQEQQALITALTARVQALEAKP